MLTEDEIRNALKGVKYPGFNRDIVSFGLVKQVAAKNGAVNVTLQLTGGNAEIAQQIKVESEAALRALPGVQMVYVEVQQQGTAAPAGGQNPWAKQNKVPGIRHIVAIASGKGG